MVIAFGVLVTYLSPIVLDPLFNRFEPLPDGELRAAVLELGERADVEVGEVYRVDASRRTTASNAYVGGLGETKRVVLYDNLIEDLPQEQVRSVVAHELAHVRYSDLPRGLLWLAIVALPSMLVVQRLTELIDRRSRPDRVDPAAARGAPAALPAVALSLAVVAFAVQIPANWLSRQVEARADAYALGLTQEPAAFVGLQRSLAVRNVSEPDPPALYPRAAWDPPDHGPADRPRPRLGAEAVRLGYSFGRLRSASVSGRLLIPSAARHFEYWSSIASISSRKNLADRLTRETTTPGTSSSSTSWSTRAKVTVNS